MFSVSSPLNPFLLRFKQNMTGSLKLLIVFLNHASSGWHMQKDTNVTTKKWSVLNILVSFYCIGSLCQKNWSISKCEKYILCFTKHSKCSLRQPLITPPSPKRFVLRSLDRMATNGYYLFSKFNRFGVCHLCELKVHMKVKLRKPFTVSKQFVRFSSSV